MPDSETFKPEKEVPPAALPKSFSEADVERLVAERVSALLTPFNGIDPAEYNALKEADSARQKKELADKGNFDALLQKTIEEKDAAYALLHGKYEQVEGKLEQNEVDHRLLSIIASKKARMPEQIAVLLRPSIKYDAKSGPIVVDAAGNQLFRKGEPVSIEQLAEDFLVANPHFVPGGPPGAGSGGSGSTSSGDQTKISEADARDPAKYLIAREAAQKEGKPLQIVYS